MGKGVVRAGERADAGSGSFSIPQAFFLSNASRIRIRTESSPLHVCFDELAQINGTWQFLPSGYLTEVAINIRRNKKSKPLLLFSIKYSHKFVNRVAQGGYGI